MSTQSAMTGAGARTAMRRANPADQGGHDPERDTRAVGRIGARRHRRQPSERGRRLGEREAPMDAAQERQDDGTIGDEGDEGAALRRVTPGTGEIGAGQKREQAEQAQQ